MDIRLGAAYPDGAVSDGDVAKPSAIPLFEDHPDFAPFVYALADTAADMPRRLASRGRRAPLKGAPSSGRTQQEPKVDLVLYTSPESEKSRRAMRAVQDVLRRYDASQVRFTTCDLSQRPEDGDADSVVFTPTLVKQGPGPRTAIIGNLERADILCDLLDASGVDRRWDD